MADQPKITDEPPAEIKAELDMLDAALDAAIPSKRLDENLLIGTWNIRSFGSLTKKWNSSQGDSPKRDFRALRAIVEIISRFDVVAVQEVKGDLRALRHLMTTLGPHWSFLMMDVTRGSAGNNERMAFVFDRRRVQLSGLACELVVPPERINGSVQSDALSRQFAR